MADGKQTDIIERLRPWAASSPDYNIHDSGPNGLLIEDAMQEIADLRTSVIAFGGPWAVEHARDLGLPDGHLHPTHYDILARAGARMDDFVRGEGRHG